MRLFKVKLNKTGWWFDVYQAGTIIMTIPKTPTARNLEEAIERLMEKKCSTK